MTIHIGWLMLILIVIGALYLYKHKPVTTA
jgi:hypothetical protein